MEVYNFSESVRRALKGARDEGERLRTQYVGTEHVLLGLLSVEDCAALRILRALGIGLEGLRSQATGRLEQARDNAPDASRTPNPFGLPYTTRAKRVLELAMSAARETDASSVGTEHLLLGLIDEQKGVAAELLAKAGATREGVLERLKAEGVLPAFRAHVPAGPLRSVTILLESADGRLGAIRFASIANAISYLTRWTE